MYPPFAIEGHLYRVVSAWTLEPDCLGSNPSCHLLSVIGSLQDSFLLVMPVKSLPTVDSAGLRDQQSVVEMVGDF